MVDSVAVIGAGTMGRSIAQFFLQNDVSVSLIDENKQALDDAKIAITQQMNDLREKGIISSKHGVKRLQAASSYPEKLEVDVVIEAIPEKLTWKQALFSKLESSCNQETLFATNTSGLSITEIASVLDYPERLIGTHFFTPAAIVPLVEVVKGERTSDETADTIMNMFKKLGKKPVLLQKEIPGFIGNRIQHALNREAISLLDSGIASAEDIDTVVKWSIGLRMALTGPIEQRDVNGLDIHYDIASYLYKDLNNETTPSSLLKEKVDRGEVGLKTDKGFYDWHNINKNHYIQGKNEQLIELIQSMLKNEK